MTNGGAVTPTDHRDAQVIWAFHQMHHDLHACGAAIGLGSHDLGVATYAAKLYHRGLFEVLVFSGATSVTTAARFPRGEAVHYRDEAIALDVPDSVIFVEPEAANTGENIALSRSVLEAAGIHPSSVLLISKPYMERRAYATCRKLWPEVEAVCTSEPLSYEEYLRSIGDAHLVIDMLVGDLNRVIEYPKLGFAVEQHVPADVAGAYARLIGRGYNSRLIGR